jgi:hypothetical protein
MELLHILYVEHIRLNNIQIWNFKQGFYDLLFKQLICFTYVIFTSCVPPVKIAVGWGGGGGPREVVVGSRK